LREVAGALDRNQDQRTAAIGHQATLQQSERVGAHPRIEHVLDGDPRFEGSVCSSPPIRRSAGGRELTPDLGKNGYKNFESNIL
jgi:hypothetical protein